MRDNFDPILKILIFPTQIILTQQIVLKFSFGNLKPIVWVE